MTGGHASESADWFGRDHALVVEAAANLADAPAYSAQLWDSAEDPKRAALQLIALLGHERGFLPDETT